MSLSTQTIRHCLSLLRKCLQSALDREYIHTNPASGITVERPKNEEVWTYLLPEEQEALISCSSVPGLSAIEMEALQAMVEFSLGSGLRQGEQWNLHLHDFHPWADNPFVYVQWGSEGKRPKGGRCRRVYLFGRALAAARTLDFRGGRASPGLIGRGSSSAQGT